jgi:hypothetical protein
MGASLDIVERWRWGEDLSDDRLIKESWAEHGKVESCSEGEMRFYAVQTRLGRQFLWNVDVQTGAPTGSAKQDRLALETLYVSQDGQTAVVSTWEVSTEETADGQITSARPCDEFCSIITRPREQADSVEEELKSKSYRQAIEHFYDVV